MDYAKNADALLGKRSDTGEIYVIVAGDATEWDREGELVLKRNGLVVLDPDGKMVSIVTGESDNGTPAFVTDLARQETAWVIMSLDPTGNEEPGFNRCRVRDARR